VFPVGDVEGVEHSTVQLSPLQNVGSVKKMIEFEIDASLLSKALDAVTTINNEPAIIFEPAGLSIVAMDSFKVILVQLSLKASEFHVYDVEDKRQKICFNIEGLQKYMRGANGTAMITIDQQVTLMLPSKYGFRTFDTPLFAELPQTLAPSKLPYDTICKIETSALTEIVRDAGIIDSDFIRFRVNNDNLDAIIKGEKGSAVNSIEENKGIIHSKFAENAEFVTATKNFNLALKVGTMFTNIVRMSFSEQPVPMKLEFQVAFDGVLSSFLAPVIGQEE